MAIAPDGETAIVTKDGDSLSSVLAIDGTKVEYTKREMSAGQRLNVEGGPAAIRTAEKPR